MCNVLLETGFSGRPNVLGDMVLTPAQTKLLKGGGGTAQAISYQARRWPRGLVPYMLHSNLSELQIK